MFLESAQGWLLKGMHRMERFLLLWDELDDVMGTSRYYVKNAAMAIWTTVRPR